MMLRSFKADLSQQTGKSETMRQDKHGGKRLQSNAPEAHVGNNNRTSIDSKIHQSRKAGVYFSGRGTASLVSN